jgi:NADPH-dependent 2,4-dienoyl-CoA reductase/sulfur reductase-like enzyme
VETHPIVVVGAGPAGMAAAVEAARSGESVTLLDEAPLPGGQVYRQPPSAFATAADPQPGTTAARGAALLKELDEAGSAICHRRGISVLGIFEGRKVLWSDGEATGLLRAESLVLAAGAYDRPMPLPGWTLPGVMTAGGAQTLLKTMGVRPGTRALVAGTGPLLLVLANQLHEAGIDVVAVLEAGRPELSAGLLPAVWGERDLVRQAWHYRSGLRKAGIPLHFNHTIFSVQGNERVESATFGPVEPQSWRPRTDRSTTAKVDLVVLGFGFVPNTELTELAGCRHRYHQVQDGWVPKRDSRMQTSVPGVFAAGDGAGVAGALVAEEEGRIAGISAAEHAGLLSAPRAAQRRSESIRRLRSLSRLRGILDEMSRLRSGLNTLAKDETLLCRCEEVTLAEVRAAGVAGARNLQAVKLHSRLGMGPCQGRNCAPAATSFLCQEYGLRPEEVGRINFRPPSKPVTFEALSRLTESAP